MVYISLSISVSRRPSMDQPSSSSPPVQQLQNTNPFASAAPSLRYTASISSRSHSHSRCPSYANSISASQNERHTFDFSHPGPVPVYSAKRPADGNNSLERLLSAKKKRLSIVQFENGRLKRRMVSTDSGIGAHVVEPFERKKSYGIGGAGNIRRPSDVIYPVRTNADGSRRRSSVWSSLNVTPGTSPEGKRHGFLGFFRRGSVQQDVVNSAALDDDVDPMSNKPE